MSFKKLILLSLLAISLQQNIKAGFIDLLKTNNKGRIAIATAIAAYTAYTYKNKIKEKIQNLTSSVQKNLVPIGILGSLSIGILNYIKMNNMNQWIKYLHAEDKSLLEYIGNNFVRK